MESFVVTGRVNQDEASAILGISTRTFRRMDFVVDDQQGTAKFYLLSDVIDFLEQRVRADALSEFQKSAPAFDDEGEMIDVETEKKKKLKAERIGQEIKNARDLGELAPLDLMRSALGDALSSANSYLETIPARIKRIWPEVQGAVLEAIERDCAQIRNTIADADITYTDPRMEKFNREP